jgi:SAM-dependent methyltransferase
MLYKAVRILPKPVRNLLSKLGVGKLMGLFYNKYTAELNFQKGWAKEFPKHNEKVLEYWRKYRYLDNINQICDINDESKVLDVGCGISSVLHYVKGSKRVGVDPLADDYLKVYNYPEGIEVKKGFGEDLEFNNELFDVVFCSNVLDHTTNPQKNINEIWRVLKPGGYFVLTLELFDEKKRRDVAHPHAITRKDVIDLTGDDFSCLFQRESPWIGVGAYVNGATTSYNKELIAIFKKDQ